MSRMFRAIAFVGVFYLLCVLLAFVCRDDTDTYTRAMMRELHSNEKIDALISGGSHVSHGLYPKMIKELCGANIMCTGTPNQPIDGTYAILKETLSLHPEVKRVFIECDFAAANGGEMQGTGAPNKGFFLVYNYLKEPLVKLDYMRRSIHPRYYLNCLIPIGKESLLDISPKRVCRTVCAKITGEYWRGVPRIKDGIYAGGGCVIDESKIEGGLSSDLIYPIDIDGIGFTWKSAIKDMAQLCQKQGIKATFFSNPSTDYYLTEKGNYDEYLQFLRRYLSSLGYEYYDFSLIKENICCFTDENFFDDNHLNRSGIQKFSALFCEFVKMLDSGKLQDKSVMFYNTFAEKTASQKPRVYGLMFDEAKDKKSISIFPVMNRDETDGVTYSVMAEVEGKTIALKAVQNASDKKRTVVHYPEQTSGKIVIDYFLHGKKQGTVSEHYTAL